MWLNDLQMIFLLIMIRRKTISFSNQNENFMEQNFMKIKRHDHQLFTDNQKNLPIQEFFKNSHKK